MDRPTTPTLVLDGGSVSRQFPVEELYDVVCSPRHRGRVLGYEFDRA